MKKPLLSLVKMATYSFALLVTTASFVQAATTLEAFDNKEGTISIAGGTAHIPVMKELAKNIMTSNPKIKITIAGGGSGVGVKQVGEGLVDIGNTGRPLKEGEIKQYGLITYPFAIDGVAAVVHPENTVANLTTEQLQKIYNGSVTNWKDIGGADAQISLYKREDGSGTSETFVEQGLKKADIAQNAAIVGSNGAMKTAVSKDVNAIGYIGIGHIDATVKALQINNVIPNQENAASGVYTVTRQLFMNTKGTPNTLTQTFIDYLLSSEDGTKAIVNAGYIPLSR